MSRLEIDTDQLRAAVKWLDGQRLDSTKYAIHRITLVQAINLIDLAEREGLTEIEALRIDVIGLRARAERAELESENHQKHRMQNLRDAMSCKERAEIAERRFFASESSRDATVIAALKNSGIDVECGACMEVAFTGVTTNQHTCRPVLAAMVENWADRLEAAVDPESARAGFAAVVREMRESGPLADNQPAGETMTVICEDENTRVVRLEESGKTVGMVAIDKNREARVEDSKQREWVRICDKHDRATKDAT